MLKNIIFLLIQFIEIVIPICIYGQQNVPEVIYRRSSLYTLMINESSRKYEDVIKQTFINTPIPDKFNNHNLKYRTIRNAVHFMIPNKEEQQKARIENINEFLIRNQIAKLMVAKWFNRAAKGTFNMNLVAERGSYNATEMDVKFAKSTKRGLSILADAGEELINNTFVVVNDFKFVSKEEVAGKIKNGLSLIRDISKLAGEDVTITTKTISDGVNVVGKGYVVKTTSYLYKLVWNDSVQAVFYDEYWMDNLSFDENRKVAFENSDIFKLKLVGFEVAWADLQSTIYTKKSEKELVTIAAKRAIDAVIAKLQRKFEVFRTKTPLFGVDPLAAKIGLKEGLEKGDKYEVLEQIMDKNGRTRYKRKGIIKVDKNRIWDNRYMAAEQAEIEGNQADEYNFTVFRGGKNYYPGMLIRQIN